MVEFYNQGKITPIRIGKSFNASEVRSALSYMHKGAHIGKIVIRTRDEDNAPTFGNLQSPIKSNVIFNPRASYVLVGGLGGLGRAIAIWMVQRGARNLTFLFRTAGSQEFLEALPIQRTLITL